MAFRFSANAKEFIPANERRNAYEFTFSPLTDSDVRPRHHHQETHNAVLPNSQERKFGEWNIAAPEFKPSEKVRLRDPGFYRKDGRQAKGKESDPESLNQRSRPKSSSWKHPKSSSHRVESQTGRDEVRGEKHVSQPRMVKQDVALQKHSTRQNVETQKGFKTINTKKRNPNEVGLTAGAKGDSREGLSRQGTLSKGNVNQSTKNSNGKGLKAFGRELTSSKESTVSSGDRGNEGSENDMYPRLLGSHPINSTPSMFSGKSWSKVLQSKPSLDNSTPNSISKIERQRGDWQKNSNNQPNMKARSQRPGPKGWASRDSRSDSNVKKRLYEPYHGDLEWRIDAENTRRQAATSAGNKARNYSDIRAVRNMSSSRQRSMHITERYKFKNVTKEFSDRVKKIIFSGIVKDEIAAGEESYLKNKVKSRGWYEPYQWKGTVKNPGSISRCLNCEGLSIKVPSTVDSREKRCSCTQKSSKQHGTDQNRSDSYMKLKDRSWSTISDTSQVLEGHFDSPEAISRSFQETSGILASGPIVVHSLTETFGNDAIGESRILEEKSGESSISTPNDELEQHGFKVEDGDIIDDEADWVCVASKSTIKARKKERLIASRKNFELKKHHILGRDKVKIPSDDMAVIENLGTAEKQQVKAKQSLVKDIRNDERKGKQGELTFVKKDQSKKKRKKKKAKAKEKPMYDNDQEKIREFKMREMIEENLKMDLVELKKTRLSSESEFEKEGVEEWPAIGTRETYSTKLMSFSEALKRWKPAPEQPLSITAPQNHGVIDIDILTLAEEERMELRRKKLKEKRKQKKIEKKQLKRAEKGEQKEPDSQKMPLTFDLGVMFDKLLQSSVEEKSSNKDSKKPTKTVLFSSGVISVASGIAKKNKPDGSRANSSKGKPSGNFLDSTQPLKMSGKERETPKKPKKTLLKKIILRAREAKQKAREAKQKAREAELGKHAPKEDSKDPLSMIKKNATADEAKTDDETAEIDHLNDTSYNDLDALDMNETVDCSNKDLQNQQGAVDDHLCEPLTNLPKEVVAQLHTRKFREYCDHFLSEDINSTVYNILKGLYRFQTRAFLENPIKAKAKRRLVLGIREVAKHAKLGKLRCVIIAPNLEKVNFQGGIDFYLSKIISNCKQFNVPIVYAMNRQVLGFILSRKVPVSAIGLLNYSGVEDDFQKLCLLVEEQREKYKDRVKQIMLNQSQSQRDDIQSHKGCNSFEIGEVRSPVFQINPEAPIFIPQSMAGSFAL